MTAPLFPSERKAARELDMKLSEFRERVKNGALPSPLLIDGLERWDIEEIKATVRGYKPKQDDEIEL